MGFAQRVDGRGCGRGMPVAFGLDSCGATRAAIASKHRARRSPRARVARATPSPADGYQAHRGRAQRRRHLGHQPRRRLYGRINKPINQLDAHRLRRVARPPTSTSSRTAPRCVGVDRRPARSVVDPAPAELDARGEDLRSPPSRDRRRWPAARLAVLDAATGDLWAARVDPEAGVPRVATAGRPGRPARRGRRGRRPGRDARPAPCWPPPRPRTGPTSRRQGDAGFAEATTEDLPGDAGDADRAHRRR